MNRPLGSRMWKKGYLGACPLDVDRSCFPSGLHADVLAAEGCQAIVLAMRLLEMGSRVGP
ncbi:MAG: hypothetical protein EVA79_06990 [Prochlorococcus sp. MED-G132]|nr:MAG: hypothetical protein EVA79_06990 [Prochlorococcus sp. MED-G132]